ncbi:hypothetical protein AGDE_07460 [Angomonas deanei]|nr:hypothetical protein AGDE_07460 [Angomonas deanei]|eukprot:EPY35324.1 hypothetical protein AGDE_07460 [Angomonas deanei]
MIVRLTQKSSTVAYTGLSATWLSHRRCSGPPKKQNPMQVLTAVFQAHPTTLRLHRELTISIAEGDVERSADLAGLLASKVKAICAEQKTIQDVAPTTPEDQSVPELSNLNLESVVDKVNQELQQRADQQQVGETTQPTSSKKDKDAIFWKSPESLTITILESAFETILPDGDQNLLSPSGAGVIQSEQQSLAILDDYLVKEEKRWKEQKSAISHTVLAVAKRLQLTPSDLHAAETPVEGKLSPLKHCNVIVRGEVPEVSGEAGETVETQLQELKKRMKELGSPMSEQEEQVARYELSLQKSKMRYVVGLHRDLQNALDHCEILQNASGNETGVSGSAFFVNEVIKALNRSPDQLETEEGATVQAVEEATTLSTPVLPFTFMLKTCLWFNVQL